MLETLAEQMKDEKDALAAEKARLKKETKKQEKEKKK